MTGKQKCEILRQIRMTIARRNGIEYPFEPCAHGSDCPGTCPACEAELQWLAEELVKHQSGGQQIQVRNTFTQSLEVMKARLKETCEQGYEAASESINCDLRGLIQ